VAFASAMCQTPLACFYEMRMQRTSRAADSHLPCRHSCRICASEKRRVLRCSICASSSRDIVFCSPSGTSRSAR
jgi:hypothetical protein